MTHKFLLELAKMMDDHFDTTSIERLVSYETTGMTESLKLVTSVIALTELRDPNLVGRSEARIGCRCSRVEKQSVEKDIET